MKKTNMMRMLLCLVMMAISVNNADAQGLKGLKSKLGGALGGAVGGTVGGAVGNAVGGPVGSAIGNAAGKAAGKATGNAVGNAVIDKKNNKSVQNNTGVGNNDNYEGSADASMITYRSDILCGEELTELTYISMLAETTLPATTLKEVLAARPALFAPSFINNDQREEEAAKLSEKLSNLFAANILGITEQNDKLTKKYAIKASQNSQENAAYSDLAMDMFKLMQQRGINPETATEEQMQALGAEVMAKKLGIPADEMVKMSKMSESQAQAYMASKYSGAVAKSKQMGLTAGENKTTAEEEDELDAYINKIEKELTDLYIQIVGTEEERDAKLNNSIKELEQIQANAAANADRLHDFMIKEKGELFSTLHALYKEIYEAWPTSAECKKIDEECEKMEARRQSWLKTTNDPWAEYPDWWQKEHEALNIYAEQWNEKQATRWNEALKQYEAKVQPLVSRMAEVEEEINAIPEEKRVTAHILFHSKYNEYRPILHQYLSIPFFILNCPRAEDVQALIMKL